jgi:predicted MFS family arabinose efflux permease
MQTKTPSVLPLMSASAGIAAANLYYVQGLLPVIASSFGVSGSMVALLPSMTQVGFAIGIILIVPLADIFERRQLLIVILSLLALALFSHAMAPSLPLLFIAAFVLGLVGISSQLLSPFAALLAPFGKEGAAVGAVLSGILSGIVMSRVVAGGIAEWWGWRTVYFAASAAALVLAILLRLTLPISYPKLRTAYWSLIRSSLLLLRDEPRLRRHVMYGALSYASFMTFWSTYAIHVEARFGLGVAAAGLFGFAGAAGIGCAWLAGRQVDRGRFSALCILGSLLMIVGFLVLAAGDSIVWAIVGALLLDGGASVTHAANQSKAIGFRPEAIARANSIYVAVYFIGGAIGTIVAGAVMSHFGWVATCMVGAGYPGLMLIAEIIRNPRASVGARAEEFRI